MAKILEATQHDIGGLTVKRILPHLEKKMVGPFIFFDHMGPTTFAPGQGVNVRPHPHIGLSTLTYLFTGSLLHHDSLGNHVEISPGDVNWMTAGRGIVHSERESIEVRASHHDINGLQCWVALPPTLCEIEPSFTHINKAALPQRIVDGVTMRLIAGDAFAMSSPVKTYSPLFYLDIIATAHSRIAHPNPLQEAAIYVIFGAVEVGEITATAHQFVLLQGGTPNSYAKVTVALFCSVAMPLTKRLICTGILLLTAASASSKLNRIGNNASLPIFPETITSLYRCN